MPPTPAHQQTVVGVAAALRARRFKSADSYLGELRLQHGEARFRSPRLAGQSFFPVQTGSSARQDPKNKACGAEVARHCAGDELLEGRVPPVSQGRQLSIVMETHGVRSGGSNHC